MVKVRATTRIITTTTTTTTTTATATHGTELFYTRVKEM